MRYAVILLVAAVAFSGGKAMPENVSAEEGAQQEIKLLIAAKDDAWNRGDAARFAARALPNVVFTNIVGIFSVGRPPFLGQPDRIFATMYKGSTVHQAIQHVTLSEPNVAIVDTLAKLTGSQHPLPCS